MEIVSVSNPTYSAPDNSTIDVQATFSDGNTYDYTSSPYDQTDYGIQLWNDLRNGVYGDIAPYTPPS